MKTSGFSKLILLICDRMYENFFLFRRLHYTPDVQCMRKVKLWHQEDHVLFAHPGKQTSFPPSCLFALLQPVDSGWFPGALLHLISKFRKSRQTSKFWGFCLSSLLFVGLFQLLKYLAGKMVQYISVTAVKHK